METTFLITTDFHASQKALTALKTYLEDHRPDAVIMAGDLINPRPGEMPYVEQFISTIKDEYQLPLFGLHGNNEPQEAMSYYRQADINIHLETRQFAGYNICGIGSFGFLNETGFEDLSVQNLMINQKTIFVTHVPPRELVSHERGPIVHVFGHKHSLAYTKQLGNTLLIQCPAGNLGRATELKLPSKKVTFVDLFKLNV